MSILHTLFVLALLLVALVVYLCFRRKETSNTPPGVLTCDTAAFDKGVRNAKDLAADVVVGIPGLDPRLEKKPRVLYYEDAIDGWTFLPDDQINVVLPLLGFDKVEDMLEPDADGKTFEETLRIRRVDLSDAEIDAMPVD